MQRRTYYEPLALDRVEWGAPLAEAVRREIIVRGSSRPFVVASPTCRARTDVIDGLVAAVPSFVGVFDGIVPHVSPMSVAALVRAVRDADADLIVTVGGGSAIDTVKVALLASAAGVERAEDIGRLAISFDSAGNRSVPPLPMPPLRQICAPTTLSGAEFSDLAGCTEDGTRLKQLFTGRGIGSASVILDPAITLGTPRAIWLSTGIRAIDHAVESLCSVASNPHVDALSQAAIGRLADALRRTAIEENDLDARRGAQLGVWLACSGLNRVPWGASHGLGHQLGAITGIAHGYCSCILLPHVLAFNHPANADRQALVSVALGASGAASAAIGELIAALGLPTRLRDVGVDPELLPQIAESALGNMFVRQNPRPIRSSDDLLSILKDAY